jgi:hypothetical protein
MRTLMQVLMISIAAATMSLMPRLAEAATIDFDACPVVCVLRDNPLSEDGFTVTQLPTATSSFISSGRLTVETTVRLTRDDGGLFDLSSLDVVNRSSLDALGTFDLLTSHGGTQSLAGMGHYTFSGPAFSAVSWVDLISVRAEFFSDNNRVDNIVVSPVASSVPEPATLALVGTALGTVGLRRRRQRA